MSIFNVSSSVRTGPPRPPAPGSTHVAPSLGASRPEPTSDARLLAILELPPHADETLDLAFRRKERELGDAFAQLSVREALALHRRLCDPRPDDAVAQRFSRLVIDRRVRLLNFLLDARRRAALAAKR